MSKSALERHKQRHLPATLAKAREAEDVAHADDLLAQLRKLNAELWALFYQAKERDQLRTAVLVAREIRECLKLFAELTKQLNRQSTVNILFSPEWQKVEAALLEALEPYPDIQYAVAQRLWGFEHRNGHDRSFGAEN